jgi:hypothetical protein
MFEGGADKFPLVVTETDPHAVLVLGKKLSGYVKLDNGATLCATHHPSSRHFSRSHWTPLVQHALGHARQRAAAFARAAPAVAM